MHGYSSSEEEEDPRRPRAAANDGGNNQDKKKKKPKPRIPPQKSINRIWKKFSNRRFHTALAVLPFDPVTPSASSDRPNELLWDGFDRAAEECRRKVQKIVKDCKRINMRYRDPGWDLDWDLKYEKGNCLNSLGNQRFEINSKTLLGTSSSIPKAVQRVHEIYENPTFMKDVNGGDVKQGGVGDCWIMSALSAMASVEEGIKRLCVAYDTKIGIYGFVFYRDGEWIYSIIDDKLYLKSPCWDSPSMQRSLLQQIDREDPENDYRKTYQTGSKALFFAQCKDQNETWVPLIEKAYAKAHGDYACLWGGWIGEGLEDLSGGVTTELLSSDILDVDEFWDHEMSRVNQEFLFGCSAGLLEHGFGQRDGIAEGHAYVVMDARTLKSGQRLVKLRNPWGKVRKGLWEGPWSDGSKEWTTEVQEELGHKFSSDSVFWIAYEDVIRKYSHFDRTRLFQDRDWRCCQRWIGVDVPWKAMYHEKFQIKLTQNSPLVVVLSQLDGRYFKGLRGQYRFRLHFRLHQQDCPDAEDYIVRSHGNYIMSRSVSVELPEMPAGNYVVYLKVTGDRDTSVPSVEDVVKRECQERIENEKLAQVGYAYDLAHSKAWDHMDKVAKMRKIKDHAKATAYRQKERRRNWEKRHLNREATKEQNKKNGEKGKHRREQWEQKQREKDEKEAEEEKAKAKEEKLHQEAEKAKAEVERAGQEAEKAKAEDGQAKTSPDEKKDGEPSEKKKQEPGNKEESTEEREVSEKHNSIEKHDSKDLDHVEVKSLDGTVSTTSSPQLTPKTIDSIIATTNETKQEVPTVNGGPPPAAASDKKAKEKEKPKYDASGDSSDSPVEDWEELYSSDDMARKPRVSQPPAPPPKDEYDTEEENMPDPWNAICIVGIRVYSKDSELELRTVLEGGALLEDGMGEKGQADLDNAQANAGGSRLDENITGNTSQVAGQGDGGHRGSVQLYPPVVRRDGDKMEDAGDDRRNSVIREYIRMDSADTTRMNTPVPMEDRRLS